MIIARLEKKTDPDGKPYLTGKLTVNWHFTLGTPVVLRRLGDEYQLLELGPRDGSRDRQAILSFVEENPLD